MSRYAIYDNESNVITPSGEEFTAEEWLGKYAWAKKTKMVVSGGVINGAVAFVFDDMVSSYIKRGADFTDCKTDQDYLDAMEAFEDRPIEPIVTAEERTAEALEVLAMASMPDITE